MANKDQPTAFQMQQTVASQFDSFVNNFKKTPKERFTVGYLTTRRDGLKEIWSSFIRNHGLLIQSAAREDEEAEEYFQAGIFEKYEEIYYKYLGIINTKLLELAPLYNPSSFPDPLIAPLVPSSSGATFAAARAPAIISGPSTSSSIPDPFRAAAVPELHPPIPPAPTSQVYAHHVQIPRLNVPPFNGAYDEWPSFRDLFVAAVHTNPTLHPVHKLQYLKSLVSGTAESLLKHIPTTAENYDMAWSTLEERFNNKRALINSTLRKLFSLHAADESAAKIRHLLDNVRECLGALRVQGINTTTWDTILVYMVSQCVSTTSLDMWEQQIQRNELPTIEQLLQFLEDRFRALEFSAARTPSTSRIRTRQQAFHTIAAQCRLCQGPQHPLRQCAKFIAMSPTQRLGHVNKAKLCKNCFAFSHPTSACRSSGTCNTCGERHHSLLHMVPNNNRISAATTTSSSTSSPSTAAAGSSGLKSQDPNTNSLVARPSTSASDDGILATALVIVKAFDGKSHVFRALLDNASQESFVSRRVVQFLGLTPSATSMTVSGVGQSQAPRPLGEIQFQFSAHHDSSFSMAINAFVLPVITHTLPARNVQVGQTLVEQLELADPSYGTPGPIDILLSATVFAELTLPSVRKEANASTVAIETKLGWVLFGAATHSITSRHRTCFHVAADDQVSAALQDFWKVEEVSVTPRLSMNDEKCEQLYHTTHTRNSDGRYIVQLPFMEDPPILGTSRDRAVSRFLQVERKLSSNPKLRDDYAKCINEYLELGHMHPVCITESELIHHRPDGTSTQRSYYLPHHAVIKEESTTTKLRVVFDASAKSSNGVSLNSAMLIGPVLQDTLFDLLIRWRIPRIVIKADIAKMYRQVLVANHHQPYQRIVWRNSPTEPLQDFQLRTVTFGTAAAPYLAIKTLQQLANDESMRFPLGAAMLKRDFYVDDLLSGANSVSEAIEMQRQVTELLNHGGFDIRKWSSNDHQVTDDINEDARELCSDASTLKALGIVWCPLRDTLSIKVSTLLNDITSKRTLLSEVAKLFDPLGWMAPSIIRMKLLLQQLWLAGLNWDEPLPITIQAEWTQFQGQLPLIHTIAIPRWLNTAPNVTIELHGFSDASEKAYAAAVYVRIPTGYDIWSVHLITAKTRVAPVKQISLPRLELCGAVLLAKLLVAVQSIVHAQSIHAWTDSEIVLSWLQGLPNRWQTFVGNRVGEIHTILDAGVWHHVPSKDNPADCASRGITLDQLVAHPIWWHGPGWLSKDSSQWPRKQKKDIAETQLEIRKNQQSFVALAHNDTVEQILNDCSSLSKAENVIVRIRRWHPQYKIKTDHITVAEKSHARDTILRHIQKTYFATDYSLLSQQKQIEKGSQLRQLNPFIDSNQLLRVGGRLEHADIPYDVRHPLIIPRKSHFTTLLITEAHHHTLHGSIALIQSYLRTRYWVLDARNTIRHIIHRCNTCFRYSNPSLTQLMGQLPRPRVNITVPFAHTGIDYAGPISVLLRRVPGRPIITKGYICLLVCLATKAIHLELVGDMSAATFLAALARFISRRGLPSDVYSDNGTYFVRAATDIDKEMHQAIKEHERTAASSSTNNAIQWHFIPPAAPHFGGLWEAGVKSMKYHLKRFLNERSCTYEELSTILCQIEGCLNSRPLCPISNDPDDFEILTPGHFLIGRPLCARPQPSTLEIPENRLDHWQQIYNTTQKFWKQWQGEYLQRLQQRPKWTSPSPDVQVGELVLLKDNNAPPSQWNLARITDVIRGEKDNKVRVVKLKTAASSFTRPIAKICPLPSQ